MEILVSSLNQMAFLFFLIAVGFLLVKWRVIPSDASRVLAKLENAVFIPALVMGTFMENFTVDKLTTSARLLMVSALILVVIIPLSVFLPRLLTRDRFTQNIYTYGLAFSNFGFMGNAVVAAMFPDIFMEYLVFVIPLWVAIYLWGVPKLLIPAEEDGARGLWAKIKPFCNPMFGGMLIGMVLGLLDLPLPSWFVGAVGAAGDCMSPIAMLLTGITVASVDIKKLFGNGSVYILSVIRLVAIPLAAIGIFTLLPLTHTEFVCAVCSLAMPLGLNTIVVPSAYGKDPSTAAGMAVVSHLLSCGTIPVIFWLMMRLI